VKKKWEEQGRLVTAMENHGKTLYLSLSYSMAKTQQFFAAGLWTAFPNVLQMPHPAKRPVKSGRRRCLSEQVVCELRFSCNSFNSFYYLTPIHCLGRVTNMQK